jgi:hypothetical protein
MCAVDVLVSDPNADFGGTNRGAAYVLFLFPNGTVKDFVVLASSASAFSTAFPPNGLSFASEYHRRACALFHSVVTRHTIARILLRTPLCVEVPHHPHASWRTGVALPLSDFVSVGSTATFTASTVTPLTTAIHHNPPPPRVVEASPHRRTWFLHVHPCVWTDPLGPERTRQVWTS